MIVHALDREIDALAPWFHNLHLPDGSQTAPDHPLGDFPRFKWEQLAAVLPDDLAGWTALDVGCNAGYYCFELARRGATVLGIDSDERYLAQARWALPRYGVEDRIRFERAQVHEVARRRQPFDLVLFMGVFYHLRYPVLALDLLARKARRLFVFQTLTMPGEEICEDTRDRELEERDVLLDPGWPKMAFLEHRFAGDPTNWWAVNHACALALLRSTGLEVVARPGHEMYVCRPDPSRPSGERPIWEEELASIVPRDAP